MKQAQSKQEVIALLEQTLQNLNGLKVLELSTEQVREKYGVSLAQIVSQVKVLSSLIKDSPDHSGKSEIRSVSHSIKHSQFLIGYFDSSLSIQLANLGLLRVLDTTIDKIRGKKLTEVFSSQRLVYGQMDPCYFATGQTCCLEFKRPDSQMASEFVRLIPDLSFDREFLGVIAISENSVTSLDREELLHNAIETMDEGFVLHDASAAILNYNASAIRLLGLTEDQLLGKTSLDPSWRTIHEDGRVFQGDSHPAVKSLLLGEDIKGTIMGVYLPSNQLRWIRINSHPFTSRFLANSGMPGVPLDRRVMVTFSDVSEIIEANFRIDTHFFLSPDLICLIDSGCKIQKVNPSFGSTLGYEDSELLGINFLDLIVSDDLSEAREFFDQDFDLRRSAEFEYRFKNKKGGFAIISWVAQSDSTTKSWYAVGRDVTAERIRNSDFHQLNAALNSSSLVSSTDIQGVIIEANSNFCKLSGYSRHELIGKTHRIVNSGYHSKQFFASMWSTIKSGKAWTGDIQNRAKGGSIYWVRSLITPISNFNNEIERFLSVRFDVSSIYEKESALKAANLELEFEKARGIRNAKLASLGEMSAGIAHEINNPLTIIGSTARILPRYVNDPDKIAQKVKTIEASVERMAKIVRGLKKFSRTSPNSDMKIHKLESIIQESTTLIESKSNTEGVPVHFKASFDGFIFCDEIEIQQVMINLISNAIDAVRSLDDRWVNIELCSEEGRAVVYVRDSGKGIPREIVDKLFLPFFTTKDVGDGTGLGLSIVKGILDAHSASIEVKTEVPNTCFEVKFPIYTQN